MSFDDSDGLNLRAYLALDGVSLDWRGDLIRLLRSDVPLDRLLRDRLAKTIENQMDDGPRLELKNHRKARDRFVEVATKHQWFEIGRSIMALVDSDVAVGRATEFIAKRAGASVKKCEDALKYFREASAWVETALRSEAGQALGQEMLERLHHSVHENPAGHQINSDLLRQLGLSQ